MFQHLSSRLTQTVGRLRGMGRLTEDNIKKSLKEIKTALINADVALPVVNNLIKDIQEKAIGRDITKKVSPGQELTKLVNDELNHLLGSDIDHSLNLDHPPPMVIVLAGLQGSGKTTTAAKLAHWLTTTEKKSVMLASADIYRPAAIEQLRVLSQQINTPFHDTTSEDPLAIAKSALKAAQKDFVDILILDTAGRLHIDNKLMDELSSITELVTPHETLLVVDSMSGQAGAHMAKTFDQRLPLTGIILTKIDGDARGGAALSMRMITGKPIKFVGVGEKIDALERFHPDRMASRILGMGDIVSLVEEAKHKIDQKKQDKLVKKIQKGKGFNLTDFLEQLQQMSKMGGLKKMLGHLPGGAQQMAQAQMFDDKKTRNMQAIIQSMTPQEREFPDLINGSRKRRIAKGSGSTIQDIGRLLKQFNQMQKMLKKMKGNKLQKQMQKMQQLQGQLPPDMQNQLFPGGMPPSLDDDDKK